MATVNIPPEIEAALVEAARRQGTTPERLAVEGLRKLYTPAAKPAAANGATLRDYLQGYVGTISGTSEPLSEDTGRRFGEMLADDQQQKPS